MRKQPRPRATVRATAPELVPAFGAHESVAIAALVSRRPDLSYEQRAEFVRYVREHIAENGYLPDSEGHYHDLIELVATVLYPQQREAADKELDRIDALVEQHRGTVPMLDLPSNIAADRYSPNIEAALHVGFALGMALIYNGGVRR